MSKPKPSAELTVAPPEFLVDRSLGHRVVALLRDAGWLVRHLSEVYDDDGHNVEDEDWISYAVTCGWALLTQDEKIRYRAHERGALNQGVMPLFYLTKKDLRIAEKFHRFHSQQDSIYRAAARNEPVIYAVYHDRIAKVWP